MLLHLFLRKPDNFRYRFLHNSPSLKNTDVYDLGGHEGMRQHWESGVPLFRRLKAEFFVSEKWIMTISDPITNWATVYAKLLL